MGLSVGGTHLAAHVSQNTVSLSFCQGSIIWVVHVWPSARGRRVVWVVVYQLFLLVHN